MAVIKIDLGDLCMAMESREDQDWYLDRETGEVIFHSNGFGDDELDSEELESDRYLWVESISSRDGFRIMEEFVEEMDEGEASRSLARALRMRGPFRCFKDTLLDFPEVREKWFAFYSARMEALAKAFLKEEDIEWEVKKYSEEG